MLVVFGTESRRGYSNLCRIPVALLVVTGRIPDQRHNKSHVAGTGLADCRRLLCQFAMRRVQE